MRDPERNAGLVGDCEALLEAKDILFARYEPNQLSRVSLNWGAEISIYEWDRVTIDGSPHRVQGLDLTGMGLTGDIPEALGWLTNLKILMLGGNQLTGCIPRGLSLEELRWDSGIDYQVCSESPTRDITDLDPGLLAQCSNGVVVPDPEDNPGLVSDCVTLFEVREALAGSEQFGWSVNVPIPEWRGVDIWGMPSRVQWLVLSHSEVTGEIPAVPSELTSLSVLSLSNNKLTGDIPAELGNLGNLDVLILGGNKLTGDIPPELGQLTYLEELGLSDNR